MVSLVSFRFVTTWLKTPYQLSRGFVGAELSSVGVLPKDVEGDATFSLQLINLRHPSSPPRGQWSLAEEVERQQLIALCICAHLCECMCKIVTTGGDKYCTLQHLSLAVDLDLPELLSFAALGKPQALQGIQGQSECCWKYNEQL